mgnify:FL=1|jgi:hypothetical protein|tara:strand:+ start:4126 stop:6261 length:2136 start_codon:yes stop_codon:yes gene_type:complete
MINCEECGEEIGTKEEIMEDIVEAHKVERNKTVEILCEGCYHEQPLGSLEEDYNAETFEAKEIMDCSLCGNNLSPIPKDYNGDSLGAYLNNDDDNHGQGSPFHAIGECNNCNLTYFSPPIRDVDGLKSNVLCNNWAEEDGEGSFCAYPYNWNEMWEKRCEKCESGLHGRKGEIRRLNEHDCMDNSKVEIIEGDMILLECEICKKTKQYVSNQKSFNVEFNEWADQEMNSHGKNISFKDWAQDEGMKHGNTEITEWAQHEDESHDARYGAETLDRDKTWANRENMSYFFVFEEDERGIRRQTPYRTKEGAIKAGEKPDEIYEYRGLNSISKEERNEQKKDRREWTERGEKGEFFEDFWWKGEMGRYANSDYERLHHSLYDSSTENDEKDGFYEKTILPTNPSRMEQEVNQAYAQEYGISERLGELLNSSRSFGMYISQRAHPDTVKKYRQKILDGFDSYKPQSEREKKIVKRVRENMAKRGVKGPSPSYWGMSQGVLRKPELSYVYADYYDNPIPFMGYELTDDERKIIVPASLSAESTDSFWDWEDPTDGKDLFKLTKLEDKVLTKFKGLLYNWGSEPGYSDVFEPELRKKCNITKAKMSEVLSSLVDKDLVALHDHEFEVEDKRSRWGGYKLVTQVLVYPLANMYVYFNEYEGLEGHWRETPSIFGAEKKRSGILSDPFEEASLDSGGTKKVLLAIGLGIIGYFGYNKWK